MDQKLELAGLLCNIVRRLNTPGGSELEPRATRLALAAVASNQPIAWHDRTPLARRNPPQYRRTAIERKQHSRIAQEVRESLYANGSQLDLFNALLWLRAIADNRIIVQDGQVMCLPESTTPNPLQDDEFLFRNPSLTSMLSLPATAVVALASAAHRAFQRCNITTLGELLYLNEAELKKILYSPGNRVRHIGGPTSSYIKHIPHDQIAAIICELDRRGLHLTRLDKTQPPPDRSDRWICLSRDVHTFPVVLESQVRSTGINPIPIEWLFGRHGRGPVGILRDIEIRTTGQLLLQTQQSLLDLLVVRLGAGLQATSMQYDILRSLKNVKLKLAPEPTFAV